MLTFNLQRVKSLITREVYVSFLPTLKISGIIILLVYAINVIARIANPDQGPSGDDFSGTIIKFGLILLIGGFLNASVAFREFRTLPTRAEYLALPGSSLEKLSVKWLISNPLFILMISLMMALATSIFGPIIAKFGGSPYTNEIFFSRDYWNLVGIYFVIHSIFLLGSIAFNKYAVVKTILVLLIALAVVVILNALFFRIVYADMFDSLFQLKPIEGDRQFGDKYDNPGEMWQIKFFIFVFKYLLAPVVWVASLFKLSEKEV
jgi:hypothetical protein